MATYTLSSALDSDLASGRAVKVVGLTHYLGHSYADVVWADGTQWVYFDADYVRATGEAARRRFILNKPLTSNELWVI